MSDEKLIENKPLKLQWQGTNTKRAQHVFYDFAPAGAPSLCGKSSKTNDGELNDEPTGTACTSCSKKMAKLLLESAPTKKTSKEISITETLTVGLFKTPDGLDKILKDFADQYKDLVFDIDTPDGREQVKDAVKDIKSAKKQIEDFGAAYAKEVKALPKVIDGVRRNSKAFLVDLEEKVSHQLNEWKAKEQAKKDAKKKAEYQKVIDADRDIAMMMMERDFMFIQRGEDFMHAERMHQEAQRIEKAKAAALKQQEDATKLAQLQAKTAADNAAIAEENERIANEKAAKQALINKQQQEQFEQQQEEARIENEKKEGIRVANANFNNLNTFLLLIRSAESDRQLTDIATKAKPFFGLSYLHHQVKADEIQSQITEVGKQKREYFAQQALITKVHIVYPDVETSKLLMNSFIDVVVDAGFLFAKQGDDTLVITKPEPVQQPITSSEWDLK